MNDVNCPVVPLTSADVGSAISLATEVEVEKQGECMGSCFVDFGG